MDLGFGKPGSDQIVIWFVQGEGSEEEKQSKTNKQKPPSKGRIPPPSGREEKAGETLGLGETLMRVKPPHPLSSPALVPPNTVVSWQVLAHAGKHFGSTAHEATRVVLDEGDGNGQRKLHWGDNAVGFPQYWTPRTQYKCLKEWGSRKDSFGECKEEESGGGREGEREEEEGRRKKLQLPDQHPKWGEAKVGILSHASRDGKETLGVLSVGLRVYGTDSQPPFDHLL